MEVVCNGTFKKEGSWVRSWKERYFEIVKDGQILYKQDKDSTALEGSFDISGRLDCSRYENKKLFPGGEGLTIYSASTKRLMNVMFDTVEDYRQFCVGVAKVAKFHNLHVSNLTLLLHIYFL